MNNINKKQVQVLVIGAGLTGLTLAYELKKAGKQAVLVEKADRVGGVIQTIHQNGFTIEAGPNTGVLGTPEMAELFEALHPNCELQIANNTAKARWIWKKGKFHALPSGLLSAIKTPLFKLSDKLRILGEPLRRKGKNEMESVADMVKRRLGKSFLQYAVDPFVSGIYAGNPEKLITKYALPKLYALESNYGSFIKGAIKKKKENKTEREQKATRQVFSAHGGLESLTNAIHQQLDKGQVYLNVVNIKVEKHEGKYHVVFKNENNVQKTFCADYLVSTVPSNVLPDILHFVPKHNFEPILKMPYAKIIQVAIGYKHWDGIPLKSFGGLVPSCEQKPILGILFPSSIFPDRAPEGGALLSVFMGGVRNPNMLALTDEEIEYIVISTLNEMLHVHNKPDVINIFRYHQAIAQYDASSPKKLNAVQVIENEHKGLFLAGSIRDGIAMADRVKQAKTIAQQIK